MKPLGARKEVCAVMLLFILALFLRLNLLLNSDNFSSGEAPGRVVQALEWLNDKNGLPGHGNAGPLHFYMMAAVIALSKDPLNAPRFLNLFFGSFIIFPFFYLAKNIYGRKTAFLSALILCFYPLHIEESVVTTAESSFAFFLFSCLFFFFKYKSGEKRAWCLAAAGLLLTAACALRFEGWAYILLLGIFLLKENKLHLAVFLAFSMIYPAFNMSSGLSAGGKLFSFAAGSAEIIRRWYWIPVRERVIGFSGIFWDTLSPAVVIFGYSGLLISFLRRRYLPMAVIFISLLGLLQYKVITGTLRVDEPRLSLHLGLILIPLAVICLREYALSPVKGRWNDFAAVALILPVLCGFLRMSREDKRLMQVPASVKSVAVWLKQRCAKGKDIVVLDRDFLFSPSIILYSSLLPSRVYVAGRKNDGGVILSNGATTQDIGSVLEKNDVQYMIVFLHKNGGILREYFNIPESRGIVERGGLIFRPVFETEKMDRSLEYSDISSFRIYQLF